MDNPRVLLFIALSFLFLLIWQAWIDDYGPKPATEQVSSTERENVPGADPALIPQQTGDDLPSAAPESIQPVETARSLAQGQRVQVETDVFRIEIDTQGGDVRIIDLLGYPQTTKADSLPFHLLTDRDRDFFIAQAGLRSTGDEEPNHYASFKAEKTRYSLAAGQDSLEVPLYWTSSNGVKVTKLFRFHRDSYEIEVEFLIDNQSSQSWSARAYHQLQRTEPADGGGSAFVARTYTGGVIYSPEEKYEKIDFGDMRDEDLKREFSNGWAAMIQHYFLTAWIPEASVTASYYSRALNDGRFVLGFVDGSTRVEPGAQASLSARLYAGPKLQNKLKAIAPGLELTVDYGILTFISQPLFWLLDKIHGIVNNWGWAIIFLTMLIKLAFFKLSETSYKSMANMRKLAPRLKSLKERYGDDKQRMNQAMMEMYKTEKINPLGGCLPVLVQIPVFIALYWVLLESVELRQAPFMLWLKDLSSADPYFVLPLIMGVTMLIQQKLNPAPMDPIQAKVMMVLPIVFTVFFAFFPSGLVLYWVVNNVLSIAQQWVITRRVEAGTA
ncbi:MAG: membrane protein insertase YidC [Gammaproteobacteria bacterium]